MVLLDKMIGNLGGVGIAKVKLEVVDGVVGVAVESDLPAVIVAAVTKTENKIDDVPGAIAAGAIKMITKDFADLNVGTIRGVAISHLDAKMVAGVLTVGFRTDIPAVGPELAKETQNKIDDVVADLLSKVLVALT